MPKRILPLLASLSLLAAAASPWAAAEESLYFSQTERYISEFDINDPGNELSLMGDLQGTSMMLKVKSPKGVKVGVFKPTSGNTSHVAELSAYRLCRRLGLPTCLPTVKKTLRGGALRTFIRLLEERRYEAPEGSRHAPHFEMKERFRAAMLDRLKDADALEGAFKVWMNPLILYEGLGTVEAVRSHPLYPYLRHDAAPEPVDYMELRQCTSIYRPEGCYMARLPREELLRQFSGILVVDALTGNSDRFAGGNLHLFSLQERYLRGGEKEYLLPHASLLMLDNGAGFMQDPGAGLRLLREDIKMTRFSRRLYEALLTLDGDLEQDPELLFSELGLVESFQHAGRLSEPRKAFQANLEDLLDYIEALEEEHGERVWY